MANDPIVNEIREDMATIKKLLAAQVGQGLTMGERAFLLHRLGVDRNTIAQVCGTNPEVISVRIAEAKRRGARRPTNARAAANTRPATDEAAATTEATV